MEKIGIKCSLTDGTNVPGGDVCPYCFDSGWEERQGADGYTDMTPCRCGLLGRRTAAVHASFANIPQSFLKLSLDGFRLSAYQTDEGRTAARAACKAVKYWLSHLEAVTEQGKGLYLYSSRRGSGKTRMAAGISHELIYKKNMRVKFISTLQLVQTIRESWGRQGTRRFDTAAVEEGQILNALLSADILVLDDFGAERAKEASWIDDRMAYLINGRYADRKATIYTSCLHPDELGYDERIRGKIKEGCFLVPFPEESVRDYLSRENQRALFQGKDGVS